MIEAETQTRELIRPSECANDRAQRGRWHIHRLSWFDIRDIRVIGG